MTDDSQATPESSLALHRVDEICDQFEEAWKRSERPSLEAYLELVDASHYALLLRELLLLDVDYCRRTGRPVDAISYQLRFAPHAQLVSEVLRESGGREASWTDRAREGERSEAAVAHLLPLKAPGAWLGSSEEGPARYRLLGRLSAAAYDGPDSSAVLFLAFDARLHREVTIKLFPPDATQFETCRRELAREAEVLASLAHPCIPPVADVGEDPASGGYLVLSVVPRQSLSESIARFLNLEDKQHERPAELRRLVATLAKAARAIDFAHGRQVIHGSLTPSSIWQSASEEIWVLDWAIAVGGDSRGGGSRGSSDRGLSGDESTCDFSEMRVSWQYDFASFHRRASTERDAGGYQDDLYSLGAILFLIVHGRCPEGPVSSAESETGAAARSWSRPDDRTVLGAIADRALSPMPPCYETVAALADDLEAWLEGRPVAAVKDWPSLRLHRRLSPFVNRGVWLPGVLLGVLAAVGGYWLASRNGAGSGGENAIGLSAYQQAVEDLRQAEASRDRARQVVDASLDYLEASPEQQMPRSTELLQDAIEFYEGEIERAKSDGGSEESEVRSYVMLGRVHSILGNTRLAEVAFRRAQRALQSDGAASSEVREAARRETHFERLAHLKAEVLAGLAAIANQQGKSDEALQHLQQRLLVLHDADTRNMKDGQFQLSLAHFDIAQRMRDTFRLDPDDATLQAALSHLEQAVIILERQIRMPSASLQERILLAHSYLLSGRVQWQLGETHQAALSYQAGEQLIRNGRREDLTRLAPTLVELQLEISRLRLWRGDDDSAMLVAGRALDLARTSVDIADGGLDAVERLANCHLNQVQLLVLAGRLDEALQGLRDAETLWKVVADNSRSPELERLKDHFHLIHARLQLRQGHLAKTHEHLGRVGTAASEQGGEAPDEATRAILSEARALAGEAWFRAGEFQKAREALEETETLRTSGVPQLPWQLIWHDEAQLRLAQLEAQSGDETAALKRIERIRQRLASWQKSELVQPLLDRLDALARSRVLRLTSETADPTGTESSSHLETLSDPREPHRMDALPDARRWHLEGLAEAAWALARRVPDERGRAVQAAERAVAQARELQAEYPGDVAVAMLTVEVRRIHDRIARLSGGESDDARPGGFEEQLDEWVATFPEVGWFAAVRSGGNR